MKRHRTRRAAQENVTTNANGNPATTDGNAHRAADLTNTEQNYNNNGNHDIGDSNTFQKPCYNISNNNQLENGKSAKYLSSVPRTSRRLRSRDSSSKQVVSDQKRIRTATEGINTNGTGKDTNNDINNSSRPKRSRSINASEEIEKISDAHTNNQHHNAKSKSLKRIKLTMKPPPKTITHPDQITQPTFHSLQGFLNSYKCFQDDELSIEEYEQKVNEEVELVRKLRIAIHNKALQIDPVTGKIIKRPKQRPYYDPFVTLPTHQDHLVAQGSKSAKIFQDNRRAKIARCKKIANMVENHFKRIEGEKDRAIKEHEKSMRKLARNTAQMVKKRWREVEKAYKIIVDKRKELEKIEESKKTMNRMVMDSSLRAVGHAIAGAKQKSGNEDDDSDNSDVDESEKERSNVNNNDSDDNDDDDSDDDNDDEHDDERDDEHDDSDDDNEDGNIYNDDDDVELKLDEDDSKLTQEELRKKYAFLETYQLEKSYNESDDESEEEDNKEEYKEEEDSDDEFENAGSEKHVLNGDDNKSSVNKRQESDEELHQPEEMLTNEDIERFGKIKQEEHNSVLDSDEESSLLESDEESESESDSDDEEVSGNEAGSGLAALFAQPIIQDDSDDEDVELKDIGKGGKNVKIDDGEESIKKVYDGEVEKITEIKQDVQQQSQPKGEENIYAEVEDIKQEKELKDLSKDGRVDQVKSESPKPSGQIDGASAKDLLSSNTEEDSFASIPDVPIPSLLRGTLRAYQKQGLNWLANLYNNDTNGILADEMGLGKTIQTISLISYLACEKHIWGPHLIVVPTSVMLNWEMEFKRFAPGFKILTYYGNPQQRKEKRKGWNKPNAFHVCITSYQLVCHDHQSFRRRKWEYMILDEAHNIKNFRTTRWQSLLNFNTNRRLLLTGTPLQNNLAELWSLLYFLMPSAKNVSNMPEGFASLDDFQQWFGRPVDKIIEGGHFENDKETKETIAKLHKVLRPYLLRRLKADVETQMPGKYEHIVYCRLSKRQRFLYDDFMSRAQTKETLASGNFLSIINCLMQLRKVCNHPDLFEVRPILTSFAVNSSIPAKYVKHTPGYLGKLLEKEVDLNTLNFIFTNHETELTMQNASSISKYNAKNKLILECNKLEELLKNPVEPNYDDIQQFYQYFKYVEQKDALDHSRHAVYINDLRCSKKPVFGKNLLDLLHVDTYFNDVDFYTKRDLHSLDDMIKPLSTRILSMKDAVDTYAFVTPSVVTLDMKNQVVSESIEQKLLEADPTIFANNSVHEAQMKLSIQFPDKSLLLYDSGKLQKLAKLLYDLKNNGHRALIFTQMTKVLDILEKFLNSLGYLYARLDGATKIEDRQLLTEKFNRDPRITCFILSTRSGGLGINLTGADTVIFYDNDWNPAMDKQCQDRCHRIGQTRDVHIYRFVSEYTIEENIMKKSNYKRQLDNVVIQEGDFTTDYFGKLTLSDLLGEESGKDGDKRLLMANGTIDNLAQAEDAEDVMAAKEAIKESQLDVEDFDESGAPSKSISNSPAPPPGSSGSSGTAGNGSRSRTRTPVNAVAGNGTVTLEQQDSEAYNEEEGEDEDDEDEDDIGHIDEYMLRFIENGYYF